MNIATKVGTVAITLALFSGLSLALMNISWKWAFSLAISALAIVALAILGLLVSSNSFSKCCQKCCCCETERSTSTADQNQLNHVSSEIKAHGTPSRRKEFGAINEAYVSDIPDDNAVHSAKKKALEIYSISIHEQPYSPSSSESAVSSSSNVSLGFSPSFELNNPIMYRYFSSLQALKSNHSSGNGQPVNYGNRIPLKELSNDQQNLKYSRKFETISETIHINKSKRSFKDRYGRPCRNFYRSKNDDKEIMSLPNPRSESEKIYSIATKKACNCEIGSSIEDFRGSESDKMERTHNPILHL